MEYKKFEIELFNDGCRVFLKYGWIWFACILDAKNFIDNYAQKHNEKETK